jgi:hypothetical protein
MANGIVPTTIHGRIKCQRASRNTLKLPVISALSVTMLEAKVMTANLIPVRFCKCQVVASGAMETPEDKRPEGGIQKGVPFNLMANTKAIIRPSQKTGIDGHWHTLQHNFRDRPAILQGYAEISMGYITEITHKLNLYGIVQTVIFSKLITLRHSGLFPQDSITWIARQDPGQGKRNNHNSKENRKEKKNAPDDIESHKRMWREVTLMPRRLL